MSCFLGICSAGATIELFDKTTMRCRAHGSIAFAKLDVPLNIREDGRGEGVCDHGIGHTLVIPERVTKSVENTAAWFAHGCDRCCGKWWEAVDVLFDD